MARKNIGRSPHEMIEDSLLFGVNRFERKAEAFLQKADKEMGIDPKIGVEKRKMRKAGRAVLQSIAWRTPVPPPEEYALGRQALRKYGYLEPRKSKKGMKLSKKAKSLIKQWEKPYFK